MLEVTLPAVANLSVSLRPPSTLSFVNQSPAALSASTRAPATLELTMRAISSANAVGDIAAIVRSAPAGQTLSGHRAVYISGGNALYADAANLSQARACAGITLAAADAGANVRIQELGPVVEPSWNWTQGPVYLGAAGALTQSVPTTGALVEIGIASSATQLDVRIRPPIYLS